MLENLSGTSAASVPKFVGFSYVKYGYSNSRNRLTAAGTRVIWDHTVLPANDVLTVAVINFTTHCEFKENFCAFATTMCTMW